MSIFAGSCTLLSVVVPETYAPVLLAQKAKRLRTADPVKNKHIYAESDRVSWSFFAILERTIFRPFKMQLVEPILLLTTIYISLAHGVMFASMFVTSFLPKMIYLTSDCVQCSRRSL
jgi:DHA1 family multidrug resistance protein-like MFS transporter